MASLQIHFWGEYVEIPIHFQRDPPQAAAALTDVDPRSTFLDAEVHVTLQPTVTGVDDVVPVRRQQHSEAHAAQFIRV